MRGWTSRGVVVSFVACAAVAVSSASAVADSGAGQLSRSISSAQSNAKLLVGDWLGPGDGATNCGTQVDELWLYKNLSFYWTFKSDSPDCADVTFWGKYKVTSATQMWMYPTGSPCGTYCTPHTFRMKYHFITRNKNAVSFCGYAGASCLTHYRQKN